MNDTSLYAFIREFRPGDISASVISSKTYDSALRFFNTEQNLPVYKFNTLQDLYDRYPNKPLFVNLACKKIPRVSYGDSRFDYLDMY